VSESVIEGLSGAAATFTQLRVETSLHPFASDHVPFIDAGIPAVRTIEGADNTNGNIHSDLTRSRVNTDFAAEILRMIVGFVGRELGKC
jgi:Zn-dependent M28 family amino/carboxypeptidase